MRTVVLVVGFVCAIGLGVLFGRAADPGPVRQPVRATAPESIVERPTPPPQPLEERALENRLGYEPTGERAEQVRRLSAEIRETALRTARDADEIAARRVAEEIATEKEYEEDLRRGGAMTLLRKLQDEPAHLLDLVGDRERFAAMFERAVEGGVVLGPGLRPDDPIEHGSALYFPAGAHAWKERRLGRRADQVFPRDLLVRGDGMDVTLIRLDEIQAREGVQSLTFQDCTIDCGNAYLTDLRGTKPSTIRMERCRVVRFDNGAGGSSMLNARTAAFHAIDCRFESGFGSAPGFGNLFDVRGDLLVRLEGCTIVGPFRSVYRKSRGSSFLFVHCSFVNQNVPLESPPDGVQFVQCTSTPPTAKRPTKPRLLSEINPDWPQD